MFQAPNALHTNWEFTEPTRYGIESFTTEQLLNELRRRKADADKLKNINLEDRD